MNWRNPIKVLIGLRRIAVYLCVRVSIKTTYMQNKFDNETIYIWTRLFFIYENSMSKCMY